MTGPTSGQRLGEQCSQRRSRRLGCQCALWRAAFASRAGACWPRCRGDSERLSCRQHCTCAHRRFRFDKVRPVSSLQQGSMAEPCSRNLLTASMLASFLSTNADMTFKPCLGDQAEIWVQLRYMHAAAHEVHESLVGQFYMQSMCLACL